MKDSVVIVGGGAAGLAAAVFCARRIGGEHVVVMEKQARVGKKLLATGNGTCNISNMQASPLHYHGMDPSFVTRALDDFTPAHAIEFFSSVGVRCTVRENGRVYPLCAQASAVLDCLREELDVLGVRVFCDRAVTALRPMRHGVEVVTEDDTQFAHAVLVAAGGAASASLGGGTDGYALLQSLGHRKTPLFPAIVQIRTEKDSVKAVKGVRVDATLSLELDGRRVASCTDEVLFADYGLSGPAAMAIGRYAADWERRRKGHMMACLDLLPSLSEEEVRREITLRASRQGRTLETMLTGLLQKRLGQTIIKAAGLLPLSRTAQSLSQTECDVLARCIKRWALPVTGCAGMNAAQVTAGGIAVHEVDPSTMRSLLSPNVYVAGEVLDIDGDCGGYNLQWAWSSAYAAATAMTEGLL